MRALAVIVWHYMVARHFGVGFFMDVLGNFVGKLDVSQYDYGALGFGFGLSLRTVL